MLFSVDVQSHPGVQSHPDLRYLSLYLRNDRVKASKTLKELIDYKHEKSFFFL